jgi:hypothetical protein
MRHPRTLIEFMQMYPSEEDCRQAIFEHRWPQGFRCRRCGHERAWRLRGRSLYECTSCHYQGSLTAGTIFHGARTDLRGVVPRHLAPGLDQEGALGGRALAPARRHREDRLAHAAQDRPCHGSSRG